MGARLLTPSFMFDLESNMRLITSSHYQRLVKRLWWQRICKTMQSGSKREIISWLLETATIEVGVEGQATFESLVGQTAEYEAEFAQAGLELLKSQLEDLDGNGVQAAAQWSKSMGAYAGYWPQKQLAKAILANGNTYDGKAFFAVDHPCNPFRTSAGAFANLFTGAASGAYPGAVPIHGTGAGAVDVDTALENLAKVIAYISTIPMPSGEDPRLLRVAGIFGAPALTKRLQQLTHAKSIAQAATSGAGSADVEAVILNMGLGEPVETPELAAAFGGSDTDYYIACEEITSDELGAFTYVNREPFNVTYHGPMTEADLARRRKFEWLCAGRNVIGMGHPYLFFKCRAT